MTAEQNPETAPPRSSVTNDIAETAEAKRRAWRRYGFAIVPAVAFLELAAHIAQVTSTVPDADWVAARDAVKSMIRPGDLVAFAPRWTDPIGRSVFKDDLAREAGEARADDTRFARAIEVSIRGKHLSEFDGWRVADRKRVNTITLTTYENPSPAHVIDDLVTHLDPARANVSHVDGNNDVTCPFGQARAQSGNIGFGPTIPAARYSCPQGSFVGVSVVQSLEYLPHRCIYTQVPSGIMRIRFDGVTFGRALHGHHAISWAQERFKEGTPVTIVFKVGDEVLGKLVHKDGDGWKPFELDTSAFAGQSRDLVAEIAGGGGRDRYYCFEADTR